MSDIIKAEHLSYDYVKLDEEGKEESVYRAVSGVDLNVKAGDFIAILGHNGSGKSTLAKHINAILLPSEGTLFIDGKNIPVDRIGFPIIRLHLAVNKVSVFIQFKR